MLEAPPSEKVATILAYHDRTKHHLHRFAASSGYLDWETQPNPFRTFEGAPTIDLPLSAGRLVTASYGDLYASGTVTAAPIQQETVAALFELALGLSAWKQYQDTRWALRCNPSSGNLHPTEGYAIVSEIKGLDAGVYHYLSRDHRLERRCTGEGFRHLLSGGLLVGLSSIHWRESWKYGERAFRYCQHDAGHAIATVRYAAAALGWRATLLDVSDSTIADLLGLSRLQDSTGIDEADREHPDALLLIGPDAQTVDVAGIQAAVRTSVWTGRPNVLSPDHTRWPVIDIAAEATWRNEDITPSRWEPPRQALQPGEADSMSAVTLIRQRRSAVAFDDSTAISSSTFYRMLDRLLPRPSIAPWDVLPWPPHLHCGIFAHRVDGLKPGLYFFLRNPASRDRVRGALDPKFPWDKPPGCPEHLPLYRLLEGDFRQQAQLVSCHQKIAGAGAFSLGMVAEFAESIGERGAWWYRRLFWESGVLGQVLYLEAEAAGVRGTGIGCYFDEAFHRILGLRDNQLQSLYHFTIGGPVEDTRLMTLPPYAHLKR